MRCLCPKCAGSLVQYTAKHALGASATGAMFALATCPIFRPAPCRGHLASGGASSLVLVPFQRDGQLSTRCHKQCCPEQHSCCSARASARAALTLHRHPPDPADYPYYRDYTDYRVHTSSTRHAKTFGVFVATCSDRPSRPSAELSTWALVETNPKGLDPSSRPLPARPADGPRPRGASSVVLLPFQRDGQLSAVLPRAMLRRAPPLPLGTPPVARRAALTLHRHRPDLPTTHTTEATQTTE